RVPTAAKGNLISAGGMLLAAVVTLYLVIDASWTEYKGVAWLALGVIIAAIAVGAIIGMVLATRVQMTGMPEMVALLNGFGGVASLLVACGDYLRTGDTIVDARWNVLAAIGLATLIGGVTFTGSLIAFAKL